MIKLQPKLQRGDIFDGVSKTRIGKWLVTHEVVHGVWNPVGLAVRHQVRHIMLYDSMINFKLIDND